MGRLTTDFWVFAYLAQLQAEGVHAHLMHRGDAQAGAVAVKLAFMNGKASLFTRSYGSSGHLDWNGAYDSVPEAEVDAAIARYRGRDRDLWVVEIEDPRGRTLLDRPGLKEG
jgi:hypothetical protein